jgi:hypothetical protein
MKRMLFLIQYTSIIITYFVRKMQAFFSLFFLDFFLSKINFLSCFFFYFFLNFSFKLFSLVLNYFPLLYITIILFLLFFYFFTIIIFSLSMHILCPTFGYYTNHSKKSVDILCFKCGYYKIILTKLMFIL